jgi:hypothetical protein
MQTLGLAKIVFSFQAVVELERTCQDVISFFRGARTWVGERRMVLGRGTGGTNEVHFDVHNEVRA